MMESFMNLIQLVAPRKESIVGGNEGIVQSRRRGGTQLERLIIRCNH